jgi:hypothetical protein
VRRPGREFRGNIKDFSRRCPFGCGRRSPFKAGIRCEKFHCDTSEPTR